MVREDWAHHGTTMVRQSAVIRRWLAESPYLFAVTDVKKFNRDGRSADLETADFIAPDPTSRKVFNISELAGLARDGNSQQGRGFIAGHRGGRYLWQLPASDKLTVALRATGELNAHDVEDALLTLYIETWGDRPFANLRDGYRFALDESRELSAQWLTP